MCGNWKVYGTAWNSAGNTDDEMILSGHSWRVSTSVSIPTGCK